MATAAKAKVETVSTRQLAGQLAEKHELSQKAANGILEDTIGLITKHLKKGAQKQSGRARSTRAAQFTKLLCAFRRLRPLPDPRCRCAR